MRTSYMMTILIVVIIVTASGYYWTTIQMPETVQIQQKCSDTLLVLAQNWEADHPTITEVRKVPPFVRNIQIIQPL